MKNGPVAWLHKPSGTIFDAVVEAVKTDDLLPLYTTPQTKPLSDEEIGNILFKYGEKDEWFNFARAIEERHGIK